MAVTIVAASLLNDHDQKESLIRAYAISYDVLDVANLLKNRLKFKFEGDNTPIVIQPHCYSTNKHKPELRPTKGFEAKYNKVKAKLALLSSSSSASKASMVKKKGIIVEAYEWDKEEVSSDDNEMVEVKVLMALAEENDVVSKEGARNGEWVKISMRNVHTLLEMEDNDDRKVCLDYLCIDLNYVEEHRTNDTKVTIPGVERYWLSKAEGFILPNHDIDESSVCSIPLPLLKKLDGAEPIFGPKTIKLFLRIISLERKINSRNPQHAFKKCEACGSPNHTTTYHYDIECNDVSFIEPYECLEPVVLETKVSSDQNDQNDQTDQNDQPVQNDEMLNDDHSEHFNHTNEQIIDSLPNAKDIQISKHLSSLNTKNTLAQNTTIPSPPLPVPSMVTLAPQDRWSQDKRIELVNIIGNPRARMLTRAMTKQLSTVSAHECLFVDFLFKKEPKKVSEALKHLGWVDAMQDELNQFARNKVWTLVPAPYGKIIIGSRWVFRKQRDETGIVIKNKARL
uniref:Retrovirus-related Pol polyprotein from transposon TNT 1-94 n=1 Tax=Tanacetum cinerariifolium TaxID=118510 RepID=A0A6L2JVX1_TANCI|nr:retrovirus-related Pol polyprotein from transposon TNT 1-94 [Tanacetum cinerariifolium]